MEEGERRLPLMVLELLFTEEGELAAKRHRRWTTLVDYHEDELEPSETVAQRNCCSSKKTKLPQIVVVARREDAIPGGGQDGCYSRQKIRWTLVTI